LGELIVQKLMADTNKVLIAFPINLIGLACIIYCIYFVARTIKMVELQRKVIFSEFIFEFFLIWFYPIGVWLIQPRINRIIQKK
jgi:bacteriorhodopsin